MLSLFLWSFYFYGMPNKALHCDIKCYFGLEGEKQKIINVYKCIAAWAGFWQ